MYLLQFDGGSRGKPGLCAIGYAIFDDSILLVKDNMIVSKNNTNNFAEYNGLIKGLEHAILLEIEEIFVQGDSKIVINQVQDIYRTNCEDLKPLYNNVLNLKKKFKTIDFEHIYRRDNIFADSLVNDAYNKYNNNTLRRAYVDF
jgi:ribonuclease HI